MRISEIVAAYLDVCAQSLLERQYSFMHSLDLTHDLLSECVRFERTFGVMLFETSLCAAAISGAVFRPCT